MTGGLRGKTAIVGTGHAGFGEARGLTAYDIMAQAGLDVANYANLTWGNFFLHNLLPVTIGNIIGGAVMVGLVYWFIYLRPTWTGHGIDKPEPETVMAK